MLPDILRLSKGDGNKKVSGCKTRIRPVGRIKPNARVPTVRWNMEEAGYWGHINQWTNL